MSDFERNPGAIDDPGLPGGQDVEQPTLPPGDTADDTGAAGEPQAAELDLPGPDDPVAWSYVEPGTPVEGSDGERLGTVQHMLGTETEGIFHGIALDPERGGPARVIPADAVETLTQARVTVRLTRADLDGLEEHAPAT